MILTLTPNPSIDSTFQLKEKLIPGGVCRLTASTSVAGGKGINVAHAIHKAGKDTLAIFPASPKDPFLELIDDIDVPYKNTSTDFCIRVNTTLADPDGETTKLNGIGAHLNDDDLHNIEQCLIAEALHADWVVMSGSLPPGAPDNWYSTLIGVVRRHAPQAKIAVDTSDSALLAITKSLATHSPDILTPNSVELSQIIGEPHDSLEESALAGNYCPVVTAARTLIDHNLPMVLVTLGPAGAVLVTPTHAWAAFSDPVTVVSTVGAGDCTTAGFVMGMSDGLSADQALRLGVAYGTAAVTMSGTTIPSPADINLDAVSVRSLL